MAARSLSKVKQQLCALVPGWVTVIFRVALPLDHSENQEPSVGKQCSMHLHEHATVHPPSKTCASKTNLQSSPFNNMIPTTKTSCGEIETEK